MKNLDGDAMRYPMLSKKYRVAKHGPLSICMANALSGSDGYFGSGQALVHVTALLRDGIPLNGPSGYEVGMWRNRLSPEASAFSIDTPPGSFYAWLDPDLWDYDPHCVLYTKAEFMDLFEDCCRNYVAAYPERRSEFEQALVANGMSL